MTDNTPMDMEKIRSDVAQRIKDLLDAARHLNDAIANVDEAGDSIEQTYAEWHLPPLTSKGCEALRYVVNSERDLFVRELYNAVEEYARLLGRDVIAPIARESGDTAVVFITGNSMMPPLRELEHCETIWQGQDSDMDIWFRFVEELESTLSEQDVFMASPEYDNCLYIVDTRRFEYAGDEQAGMTDSLNEEWRAIKQDD